jgi:hypothetical protein
VSDPSLVDDLLWFLEAKRCAVNIPLVGRIAAVADAFDALTSDRVYRPGLPHAEAARILREAAGSQFGPDVVSAFLDSLELDDVSRPGQRLERLAPLRAPTSVGQRRASAEDRL